MTNMSSYYWSQRARVCTLKTYDRVMVKGKSDWEIEEENSLKTKINKWKPEYGKCRTLVGSRGGMWLLGDLCNFNKSHIKQMATNENHPLGKRVKLSKLKIKPRWNTHLVEERKEKREKQVLGEGSWWEREGTTVRPWIGPLISLSGHWQIRREVPSSYVLLRESSFCFISV